MQENRNLILIGMPGVGKSTIGVILAKELGYRFLDCDLLIQEREQKKLKDIIAERGVDGFLEAENAAICSVDTESTVIATGGSAVYCEEAMKHLKKHGRVLYLKISYEYLKERLHNLRGRGVVLRDGQTLYDIYVERTELYEKWADLVIDEDFRGVEETLQAVMEQL